MKVRYIMILVLIFVTGCAESEKSDKVYVEFNTSTDVVVQIQELELGNYAAVPSIPEKEGYKFIGWFLDESFTTEFNFSSSVIVDITLYSKWELIPNSILLEEYFISYGEYIRIDSRDSESYDRYVIKITEIEGMSYFIALKLFDNEESLLEVKAAIVTDTAFWDYVSIVNEYSSFYTKNSILWSNYNVGEESNFGEDIRYNLNEIDSLGLNQIYGSPLDYSELKSFALANIPKLIEVVEDYFEQEIGIPFE